MTSPGIGSAVVAAKEGMASPRKVAACTAGEDRNWTRTRMGFPFPAAAVLLHARPADQARQRLRAAAAPAACRAAQSSAPGRSGRVPASASTTRPRASGSVTSPPWPRREAAHTS